MNREDIIRAAVDAIGTDMNGQDVQHLAWRLEHFKDDSYEFAPDELLKFAATIEAVGIQEGMKREHALWELAKVGQEIELSITYEEANPPEPYCKRCGKKLGTEAHDVHTCTPLKKEWVGRTDEEVDEAYEKATVFNTPMYFAIAIEAKLKEKNNG